jgi:group I intron endonuclease
MPFGRVYLLRNLIENKVYIGQSTTFGNVRFKQHVCAALRGSESLLARAIRRFGSSNFCEEHLGYADSREELDRLEIEKIFAFRSNDSDFGYNLKRGGQGQKPIDVPEPPKGDFWLKRAVKLANKIRMKQGLRGIQEAQESRQSRFTMGMECRSGRSRSKMPSADMVRTWRSEQKVTEGAVDSPRQNFTP